MALNPVIREEIRAVGQTFGLEDDRAFPVWFAKVALDIDEDEAFEALLDGPNEKGMDLFWVDQQNKRIFIAQCKYSSRGASRPKEKDLTSLLACVNWLAAPQDLEREGRPDLDSAARDYGEAIRQDYSTQLWFVYCGERDENIDKLIRVYNSNVENEIHNRSAVHCDLKLIDGIYEEWRGEGRRVGNATLTPASDAFEVSGSFGKALVVSLPARGLADLYDKFGDQLFARNVRGWLGARKGSVNAAILDTLENDKERGNFWAYNNGITIVCDNFEYTCDGPRLTEFQYSQWLPDHCSAGTQFDSTRGHDRKGPGPCDMPSGVLDRLGDSIHQFAKPDQTLGSGVAGCNAETPEEGCGPSSGCLPFHAYVSGC